MTDRDRLIELMMEAQKKNNETYMEYVKRGYTGDSGNALFVDIADHLLANGVIVLPCKVGDKVYYVHETLWDNDYKNKVISESVKKRILKIVERPNHFMNLALEVLTFDYCFITDWVKGNIFLTKEEAEQALAERNEK